MDDVKEVHEGDFRHGLSKMAEALAEVEAAARKLQNKNFADIAAMAHRRVVQLSEHPDAHLVHEELKGEHPTEGEARGEFPFDDPNEKPLFDPTKEQHG